MGDFFVVLDSFDIGHVRSVAFEAPWLSSVHLTGSFLVVSVLQISDDKCMLRERGRGQSDDSQKAEDKPLPSVCEG